MTLRRVKKRSALPVLVAVLIGSTSAGAATVLAKPLDLPLAGEKDVLSVSYGNIERPAGPIRRTSTRPATPAQATAPATSAPTTTTQPTTTEPTTTTEKPADPPPPASSTPPPSEPSEPPKSQLDKVLELVNENRATAGCGPLVTEPHLTDAAQGHSADMAARDYFAHTTPEGETFDERIKSAGYPQPGAENIAKGQRNAEQVMKDWMNSPGHRANILNCQLKVIGLGLDTSGFYWTQDFGF